MGAQIREYRQRIRAVTATKKITRAMELMAASRVIRRAQRVLESAPYTHALTRALSALATYSNHDHPMTTEQRQVRRAGVLIIASDRGLAGAYASSAIKESEQLVERLRADGKEVVPYLVGRKVVSFYRFRHREFAAEWTGFTDNPTIEVAREIGERIIDDFLQDFEEGGHDEFHIVYTRFNTMVSQEPRVLRLLPLEVVEEDAETAERRPSCSRSTSSSRAPSRCSTRCCRSTSSRGSGPACSVVRVRAGLPSAGDEVGDRQRRRPHQEVHPAGQPGAPGRDHPRDQRNRGRSQRPRREQVR